MTHASPPDPGEFAALRHVPPPVEAWWVAEARRATGAGRDAAALHALVPSVQRLSDAFTCARPTRFADYATTPADRAAYGLFYFPQSWVRARLPLAEARALRGWLPPRGRAVRVLDVGAGTGAAGLSVATWLIAARLADDVEVTATDHAPEALATLERLAAEALPASQLRATTVVADERRLDRAAPATAGPFDLVLASFVLNEVFPAGQDQAALAWLNALASRLTPDGLLLVLEPGTKEAARRLGHLAARANAGTRLHPWGPQFHAGPWELPPDRRTWMHEVRRWEPPASLAHVNRTLWRRIHELTFSFALLGRGAPPPLANAARLHRLCSPVRRARGRLTWLGLGSEGHLGEYEIQDRSLAPGERERFLTLERGDVLEVGEALPLGRPEAWRLPSSRAVLRHWTPESGAR